MRNKRKIMAQHCKPPYEGHDSKADFETAQTIIDGYCTNKLGEVDIFNSVITCASCGNRMHLHRAKTMLSEENYYSCGNCHYTGKEKCSVHHTSVIALQQIVLQQIRWVTELARESPEVFYEKACVKKCDEKISKQAFITNVNRFIDIQELTPEIVQAFISQIYVYEKKEKSSRTESNNIDIVFTVGFREQHTERTSNILYYNSTKI